MTTLTTQTTEFLTGQMEACFVRKPCKGPNKNRRKRDQANGIPFPWPFHQSITADAISKDSRHGSSPWLKPSNTALKVTTSGRRLDTHLAGSLSWVKVRMVKGHPEPWQAPKSRLYKTRSACKPGNKYPGGFGSRIFEIKIFRWNLRTYN